MMCQLYPNDEVTKANTSNDNNCSYSYNNNNNNNKTSSHSWLRNTIPSLWPLPLPLILALLPVLPRSLYLNRGYTVWFHLTSLSYFFTRSSFLRKILILQGTGICLGWYTAIPYDWFVEGTFCHTLYRNMPGGMLPYMVQETSSSSGSGVDSYVILESYSSYAMKGASHLLDALGHPGLLCLFWKLHRRHVNQNKQRQRRNGSNRNNQSTVVGISELLNDILTWPVIVAAWHFSRMWSMVHSYYNNDDDDGDDAGNNIAFWYFGHDVYILNNLDAYLIAYVAEGICFVAAIALRLYWDHCSGCGVSSRQAELKSTSSVSAKSGDIMEERCFENVLMEMNRDKNKPALVHSESAVSTSSIIM
jgi:hypothetical protein